ncbi:amidohydrolase family protein [candidate division KSB1 bacterium]|nr:amidohydrolase family protein [candidate division KSB1 bacterium]
MKLIKNRIAILFILSILMFSACSSPNIQDVDLIISNATLIDGTGNVPVSNVNIFIKDGIISHISSKDIKHVPGSTILINATGKYVMPGLVDVHVHFSSGGLEPHASHTNERVFRQFLYYGVTTVLNLGADGGSTSEIAELHKRQREGFVFAPCIYGTGNMLTVPGGHPIATTVAASLPPGTDLETIDWESRGYTIIRNNRQVREAIANNAALGMDGVKIIIESGPPPWGNNHPRMSPELIQYILDEANKFKLPVYAHISSLDEMQDAVKAGVGAIAHGVMDKPILDESLIQTMKENDIYYIPTLALYCGFYRYIDDPTLFADPFLRDGVSRHTIESLNNPLFLNAHKQRTAAWVRPRVENIIRGIGEAHRSGVKIVLGTDAGFIFNFPGYSSHLEMELLAKAGLSPMEILVAATRKGAEMLSAENLFGTIEEGKRADLIILNANPLDDIRNTRTIESVIKDGRLLDRVKLIEGH